ncbi:hypothetical protein [Achromobacter piechaudii]|uniref:Ner winged helix-turn-helix DNA-binding domain-containing protein n=1 Tax=Achromobacter piechaudii TaxID=72556 RepID=A0ABN7F2F4_9BURK|nr:hypothetical protein [Achromobacter piechaudii]CAB3705084.1 hypothetical protein LMG1873_02886 [Achromobacter piechaudii]CAB3959687.1 hypothetical protein LMG6103_05885 [Achromobacter piechaudii]
MKKTDAISKLGGSKADAARAIGISYQAVDKWPDVLTPRIKDRVQAAFVRRHPSDWAARWPELANQESNHE